MSLLFKATGLHAGYGRAEVLHGLEIEAGAGQVITVIGPNGADKSTLLSALIGAIPSTGAVSFAGQPMQLCTLEDRVMAGMALVPETRALFASMSVEDNLVLGGYRQSRLGATRAAQAEALQHAFTLFPRLKERRSQTAGTLSGGERQMLAVARALMGKPALLMLDEPSLGLAPLVVEDIFKAIVALRATGVSVLLIEQNARAALEIADYGYVMEMGEFVLQGPASALAHDARVVETYLGTGRKRTA